MPKSEQTPKFKEENLVAQMAKTSLNLLIYKRDKYHICLTRAKIIKKFTIVQQKKRDVRKKRAMMHFLIKKEPRRELTQRDSFNGFYRP